MFDYLIAKKGVQLPQEGVYFVVGENGLWAHNTSQVMCTLTPVHGKPPGLEKLEPQLEWLLLKMPADIFTRCLMFFRRVYSEYHSESALYLYANPETKEFQLLCPRMKVSHGGVDYELTRNEPGGYGPLMEQGFVRCGTVHSHCDFGAFHSGVDTNDEVNFSGLHMTIGHVDRDIFSVVTSLVAYKERKQVDAMLLTDGISPVSLPLARFPLFQGKKEEGYRLSLSDDEVSGILDKNLEEIESVWFPKVREFRGGKGSMGFSGGGFFDRPKLTIPPPRSYSTPPKEPDPPMAILVDPQPEVIQGKPVVLAHPESSKPSPFVRRKKARQAARSLLNSRGNLSADEQEAHFKLLKQYLGKDEITSGDIADVAGVKETQHGGEEGQPAQG